MVYVRLIASHCRACREWATEHAHWRRNEWCNILFLMSLVFLWKERGTRNNLAFAHKSVRFDGGRMMVYAGISIDGCTDFYIIQNGALTGYRYRNKILRPIVAPYSAAIGDDFILMDDNCRPNHANLVNDFLLEERIIQIEWPACSLVMNLIEHVWDILGRQITGRLPPT